MRSEENYRRMNNLNALLYRFFVWITACLGRVHEKWPKDTEETWNPTEEQREQAKSGFKTVFWALIGTNRDESAFLGRRAGRRVSVSKSGLSRRERGRLASMLAITVKKLRRPLNRVCKCNAQVLRAWHRRSTALILWCSVFFFFFFFFWFSAKATRAGDEKHRKKSTWPELESRWFQSKDFLAARVSRSHYVFEPGAFESRYRLDCACATYPSAARLPHRRNTKSQCSSSQSGKSCSTSRKELKNCVSEAPSPRTWRRPKPCPSPRESECLRKFILAENESPELQHRHAADREISDPTESASTSAVRSSSIFLAATLRCFGRMIVLHTRQHARKEGFQFEKPHPGRLEKAHPWKRIATIQNRLDRIGRAGAILTRSILTRLMRKFMRIAMETVIVWVRIARF